jgi:hypothetical protein
MRKSGRYLFSVVELVALRRVAPPACRSLGAGRRAAAQGFSQTERYVRAIPPLHAAGLSQRDNRYR